MSVFLYSSSNQGVFRATNSVDDSPLLTVFSVTKHVHQYALVLENEFCARWPEKLDIGPKYGTSGIQARLHVYPSEIKSDIGLII